MDDVSTSLHINKNVRHILFGNYLFDLDIINVPNVE